MVYKPIKPSIIISKCIEFDSCRYNAQIIRNEFVRKLKPFVDFFAVCPELEIGLGIPREPIRIIEKKEEKKLVQPATGKDVSKDMNSFADNFLKKNKDIDGAILKSKSPSCGIKDVKVYPTIEKSAPIYRGDGFFGEKVKNFFPNLAIEDELRLLNPVLRDHFLKKIYTFSSFRQNQKNSINDLIDFHTKNKFLIMSYNQKNLKIMGNIIANKEKRQIDDISVEYEKYLYSSFSKGPSCGSNINILQHAFGYISQNLKKDEKKLFLEYIKNYEKGLTPVSVPVALLKYWIIHYDIEYLKNQTFFEPYPVDLSDSEAFNVCSSRDYWK